MSLPVLPETLLPVQAPDRDIAFVETIRELHDELVERSFVFDSRGSTEVADQLNEITQRLREILNVWDEANSDR